jgi:hypothetical protein
MNMYKEMRYCDIYNRKKKTAANEGRTRIAEYRKQKMDISKAKIRASYR